MSKKPISLLQCCETHSSAVFYVKDKKSSSGFPLTIDNKAAYAVEVINKSKEKIEVYAIDKCKALVKELSRYKKCDLILKSTHKLVFVEIKVSDSKSRNWQDEAVEQLKKSISLFNHYELDMMGEYNKSSKRFAYAANPHPHRSNVDSESTIEHQRYFKKVYNTTFISESTITL